MQRGMIEFIGHIGISAVFNKELEHRFILLADGGDQGWHRSGPTD